MSTRRDQLTPSEARSCRVGLTRAGLSSGQLAWIVLVLAGAVLLPPGRVCWGKSPQNGQTEDQTAGQGAEEVSAKPSVFDIPGYQASQRMTQQVVARFFTEGQYKQAARLLRELTEKYPLDPNTHYNLARARARMGKTNPALDALATAIELGFDKAEQLQEDEDLAPLRKMERFGQLVQRAQEGVPQPRWNYRTMPTEVADGVATVSEDNVAWNPKLGMFLVFFRFAEKKSDQPIAKGYGTAGDYLRKWGLQGTAAGNHGDLYDNHDGSHSSLRLKYFPQLTEVKYSPEAKKRRLHHGLQLRLLFNQVTLGNSSTALVSGPYWRSQGRHALTSPRGPALLYLQYVTHHLYVYPEHRDYDPAQPSQEQEQKRVQGKKKRKKKGQSKPGRGDLFPVNTPYMILSQGSSGSDRVFLDAVAATLAAFRPEVKARLIKSQALMPTVQMIFRMSNKVVKRPSDYLTGRAHPTVFQKEDVDPARMVTLAHSLEPEALPPLVRLKVLQEDEGVVGRDYFDIGPREKLCDTPCAIGRLVKSSAYRRRMVVSAQDSEDLNGKQLTYHWVILRGDRQRITIKPLNDDRSQVELSVAYHPRRPITEGHSMESNRVDIGCFVHNGSYYSAPAFVCFWYLDNERREYSADGRILAIDYTDPQFQGNYVDPRLDFSKDWRDEYHYSPEGQLIGWTRIRDQQRQRFTADGQLILKQNPDGSPAQTAAVRYQAQSNNQSPPRLIQITVPPPMPSK